MPVDNELHEQYRAERKYYLGYTDRIPGSDRLISEAKAEYRKGVKEEDERMEKRRREYLESQNIEPVKQTTAVTFETVREVTLPISTEPFLIAQPEDATPTDGAAESIEVPEEETYSEDELMGMRKDDLVALAVKFGHDFAPDSLTKQDIANLILNQE